MQIEITEKNQLLNSNGSLINKGWAKQPLLQYNRKSIQAPKYKIKEWDYYCILTETQGIALTIADNGYLGFVSCTLLDFVHKEEQTKSIMVPFPLGSFKMPENSAKGNIEFIHKNGIIKFLHKGQFRVLEVEFKNFTEGKPLKGRVKLFQDPNMETMVIATPFTKPKTAFYYNQKINCLPAQGRFSVGNEIINFDSTTAMGVLDWGRGVWPYSNKWYWGSASGLLNGIPFGFNIGYGFGDTSAASENMLFYAGKANKLDQITFKIQKDNYLDTWYFSSNDKRFEMKFEPILDRYSNTNIVIIQSRQHQVFGRFSGQAILDDGTILTLKDFLGFAEEVKNRW